MLSGARRLTLIYGEKEVDPTIRSCGNGCEALMSKMFKQEETAIVRLVMPPGGIGPVAHDLSFGDGEKTA